MTIDSLRKFGANIEEGLERCMGMEDFYLEMVELGLSDERFETLGPLLEGKRFDEAFEVAHALKGVIGNLALGPLYNTILDIAELLRVKEDADYHGLYERLLEQRREILAG